MEYQSKNNAAAAWLIPFVLLGIDFFVVGSASFQYVLWPTLIGGGVGALIFWAANKDMSVSIINDKLILKKSYTEIKEYTKDEIASYRISKDQGKTVIRIVGNNKSEYELASMMLDLKGFDEAMTKFLTN